MASLSTIEKRPLSSLRLTSLHGMAHFAHYYRITKKNEKRRNENCVFRSIAIAIDGRAHAEQSKFKFECLALLVVCGSYSTLQKKAHTDTDAHDLRITKHKWNVCRSKGEEGKIKITQWIDKRKAKKNIKCLSSVVGCTGHGTPFTVVQYYCPCPRHTRRDTIIIFRIFCFSDFLSLQHHNMHWPLQYLSNTHLHHWSGRLVVEQPAPQMMCEYVCVCIVAGPNVIEQCICLPTTKFANVPAGTTGDHHV